MDNYATSPARPRLHEIDFVRGVALFGILVVNLPYYGLPLEVASGVPALNDGPGLLAWGFANSLFEFKFVSLFSLLFGMSLILQRDSLVRRRGHWLAALLRRQGFLLLIGLVHGVVLFQFDILLPYAILGTIALVAFTLPTRVTVAIAVSLLALSILLSARGEIIDTMKQTREPVGLTPLQEPLKLDNLLPNDTRSLGSIELSVFRNGPPWAAFVVRGSEYGFWLYASTLTSGFNARVLALMLLGILLMRRHVLDERWRLARRKLCVAGWLIGLPLELGSAALLALNPERALPARIAIETAHEIGSLALAAGFATALVAWAQSSFASSVRAWIATAGRMAFTNYLAQSMIANLIFAGVGLAWYGQLNRMELLGCAIVVYVAQVAASRI